MVYDQFRGYSLWDWSGKFETQWFTVTRSLINANLGV